MTSRPMGLICCTLSVSDRRCVRIGSHRMRPVLNLYILHGCLRMPVHRQAYMMSGTGCQRWSTPLYAADYRMCCIARAQQILPVMSAPLSTGLAHWKPSSALVAMNQNPWLPWRQAAPGNMYVTANRLLLEHRATPLAMYPEWRTLATRVSCQIVRTIQHISGLALPKSICAGGEPKKPTGKPLAG